MSYRSTPKPYSVVALETFTPTGVMFRFVTTTDVGGTVYEIDRYAINTVTARRTWGLASAEDAVDLKTYLERAFDDMAVGRGWHQCEPGDEEALPDYFDNAVAKWRLGQLANRRGHREMLAEAMAEDFDAHGRPAPRERDLTGLPFIVLGVVGLVNGLYHLIRALS